MRRGSLLAVPFLVAVLSTGGGAAAQEQPAVEPPPEAIEYYERGREHYLAGRYRDAVADLERALALDPTSRTLIYNLARVHELLGELDRSIEYYDRYLTFLGDDEDEERQRTEATVQRLRGAQEEGTVTEPALPAVDEQGRFIDRSPEMRRGVADAPFWITLSAGGALAGAGAVLGILALVRGNQTEDFVVGMDGDLAEREAYRDQARRLAAAADVFLIGGLATAAAAMLLYLLREEPIEEPPAGATLGTDGSGALLLFTGRL
jgi:tetratricopeptide (TPR) repeat protein